VEIGASADAVVVRDTTDRSGPVLRFTPAAWRRFADQAKQSLASRLRLLQACRWLPSCLGVAPTVLGYPGRCNPSWLIWCATYAGLRGRGLR